MYSEDQIKIQRYAQSCPEALADVMTFVLATVRTPLKRAVGDMDEIREHGIAAKAIWGFKVQALQYILDGYRGIFIKAMSIYDGYADPKIKERELIAYFASLPGFGMVKGGFVTQLAFGLGGCLDTHNLERFGINPVDVKASRFKSAKKP